MKNFLNLLAIAAIAVILTACSTPKNVAYIQNSDYIDLTRSEMLYDAKSCLRMN